MEEPEGKDRNSETALERYRRLKDLALRSFPEIVKEAVIERSPGDAPRNLRIFFRDDSFMDVWISGENYSYHWQNSEEVIRFDNAPHHEELNTFPDHLHIGEEVEESPLKGGISEKFVEAIRFLREEQDI